jgi:hypothetical protein
MADLLTMERHEPMDDALWLLEYVSKTKGAEHLKVASRKLNFVQYLCLDVVAFFFLVGFTVLVGPWLLFYHKRVRGFWKSLGSKKRKGE